MIGKILGVDFGDVRTGLAVSDAMGFMASGAGCIRCSNAEKTAERVAEEAKRLGVTKIVVGNPKNMNGTEGPRSERAKEFAARIEALTGLPVILWDERLTTVSAHNLLSEMNVRGQKRKDAVDELSARIILDAYLDSLR